MLNELLQDKLPSTSDTGEITFTSEYERNILFNDIFP
uniref:Type III restriction endonuclease subunit R n=1 Tax=Ascaris lumbricoides TaxID=6252 RepID=A0A0M3ISU2_ASCLU